MRLAIASHAYSALPNRQKLDRFAADKDIDLLAILPMQWHSVMGLVVNEKTAPFIETISTYNTSNNNRYFYHPLKLFNLLRSFKPDLIHIEEEPWSFSCLEILLMGRVLGAKVIFFTWENIRREHKWFYKLIEEITLKLSDGAIAGNKEAKKILDGKNFKKPILVNPQFGIDLEFYKSGRNENLRAKYNLAKFTLGFFARFDPQKGLRTLIEAIKGLDLQVVFVGGGPMESWLKELTEEDDRLKIIGLVKHEEIPKYFHIIDALILPSEETPVWKEQFGHVLIEAMSAQVPIIASDSGAIPEVVFDAGLIFKEGDINDLREKIITLKENQKLQKELIEKGKKRVLENYTHEKIKEKTKEFYQKILT